MSAIALLPKFKYPQDLVSANARAPTLAYVRAGRESKTDHATSKQIQSALLKIPNHIYRWTKHHTD